MGPGARGVSARRLGLSVDRRSGRVSVGRGSRGRGVPGDEGRDVSAAARESVPLDDVGGAVRDAGIVGVGARGDAVRTLHAADAQFVADAPLHVELARAGAAHRAPAHGQVGDHGHATRVRVHRARARVGRVLGSMWRTPPRRPRFKKRATGRSGERPPGEKSCIRAARHSRLVGAAPARVVSSPRPLSPRRGVARGGAAAARNARGRARTSTCDVSRPVDRAARRAPPNPRAPATPRPRRAVVSLEPPVPASERVAYRLPSFTMGHPRRWRWNL